MQQKPFLIALSISLSSLAAASAHAATAFGPAPAAAMQDPAAKPKLQRDEIAGPEPSFDKIKPTKDSIFGEPLFVNGRRVTDDEIKLNLVYGPGRLMLDLYRLNFITEDEIGRQARENVEFTLKQRETTQPFASPDARKKQFDELLGPEVERLHAKYRLSPEELQREYDLSIDDFKKQYPVLNIPAEISRAFRSVDWYVRQLNQVLYFDHVFLPANPEEWPLVTAEAMRADSGEILFDDAMKSYASRKERADQTGEPLMKEDTIYWNMMRQIVREAVYKTMDWRTATDGTPAGLALWVDANHDGQPEMTVSIEDFWKLMADTVTPTEVQEAKQWFVTYYATRDRLEKDGFTLKADECQQAWRDAEKGLEGSYMTLEIFATQEQMFPSVDIYKDWLCLREAFKRHIAPQIENGPGGDFSPLLRNYAVQANKIMGLGTVDVEVILVSAFDIPHFRWKPNGWDWAKQKSDEVYALLAKNLQDNAEEKKKKTEAKAEGKDYVASQEVVDPHRFWTETLENYSEYWDPPPPEKGRVSEIGWKKKGRFGPKLRNDLQPFIGETPYRHWATGESITDYVFFEQGEGTVAGPFKGPLGYYITRVAKRTGPTRPLNFSDPRFKDLLRDDFIRVAFVQYAKESVEKATIKGF